MKSVRIIHQWAIACLCSMLALATHASERNVEPKVFARVVPEKSEIYVGDSMLVSVMLYASLPIESAKAKDDLEVKSKGRFQLRKLPIHRELTAGRTVEDGQILYTLVWAQYIFTPKGTGSYRIPEMKFEATLQEILRIPDFMDRMFGAQPEVRTHRINGGSEELEIEVIERPLRTTLEMMQGGNVL